MTFYTEYLSPLGRITILSDGNSLTGLYIQGQKFGRDPSGFRKAKLPVFASAEKWLNIYFSGRYPNFIPPVSFGSPTPFRKSVWEELCKIPYGSTTTYGELALKVAKATGTRPCAQAVGGAVGRNTISIIVPCHRVIGADGTLTGYAGGIDKKRALLALEGIRLH